MKNGVDLLDIYVVNGTRLSRPVAVRLTGDNKFTPANVYTLRGYQTILIGPLGRPDPDGSQEFDPPQTIEPLLFRFVPTKVLKAEIRQ